MAAATAACGERPEPVGELAARYPVTVAGADEEPLVVAAAPERIVALDPGPAELIARLGLTKRLVGVPTGTRAAGGTSPEVVTTVGGAVRVGAVVRLRADLLVATPAVGPVDLARASRQSTAPVYLQPASSVDDVLRGTLELGFLLGEPARARRVAGAIRREVAAVEARVAGRAPVRVFADTGFLAPVPESSLLGDLVRRARGVSVAGAGAGADPVDACDLARRRPDVILVVALPGAPPPRPAPYACRGDVTAQVVAVREDLVGVAGARIARALAAVARALHPDAFS